MKGMKRTIVTFSQLISDLKNFFLELSQFIFKNLNISFVRFEYGKKIFATVLYRQRGKNAKRFMHTGMASLAAFGMIIAPVVAQQFPGNSVNPWDIKSPSMVLSAATQDPTLTTEVSDKMRSEIVNYTVESGDTVSSIASKFDVSTDTVLWQNNLIPTSSIKVGQTLEILPVTGVSYKVQKGDTIYSISKKFNASSQAIVDFPYNTFANDETFELAIGEVLIVPDGVMPNQVVTSPVFNMMQNTPNAGTVTASGIFIWPVQGVLTQRFSWYHNGIDIANSAAPDVLAADSGTVIVAGWVDNYGFGNRVVIDHGNGYHTLYAHLQRIYVVVGQTVNRGDKIGKMGSTGRSTGTHTHFTVLRNGVAIDPISVLR